MSQNRDGKIWVVHSVKKKPWQCDSPSTFYKFIIIIIDNIIIGIIIINSPDVVPCHRLGLQASPAWKPIAGGPTGLRKAPGCHWSWWRWRWWSSWPMSISISSSSRDRHHMIIWPLLHHHKIIMRSSYDPMMIHLAHVFLRNNWGRGGMACHCHRHLSIIKVHIRNTMQYWCNIMWLYLHQQQQSS